MATDMLEIGACDLLDRVDDRAHANPAGGDIALLDAQVLFDDGNRLSLPQIIHGRRRM
jgi:hypothetical protein